MKENLDRVFKMFKYGETLKDDYLELANMYYSLMTSGQTFYAKFEHEGKTELIPAATMYSKHRFDELWLYRKSQLIRSKYAEFVKSKPELRSDCKPFHLVFTVPHKKGLWRGLEFYGKELMKEFHELRKKDRWNEYFYGGEYGLEVTKSKNNGLHIHLHVLVFQFKAFPDKEVRAWVTASWDKLVGNGVDKTRIHYETLFVYKRNENGEYEYEMNFGLSESKIIELQKEDRNPVQSDYTIIKNRIKEYYSEDWPEEKYICGILECIKYHFKIDGIRDEAGNYDIELIQQILNNSKGMRFYSRFGKFYGEKLLNFNNLGSNKEQFIEIVDEETGEVITQESEEENIQGSSEKFEEKLLNPFTKEKAKEDEFVYVLTNPSNLKYKGKPNYEYIHSHKVESRLMYLEQGLTLKDHIIQFYNKQFQRDLWRSLR